MERFDCLSAMLYYKVNEIIGDREVVSTRRETFDMKDAHFNTSQDFMRMMVSGSKREGLDMGGSDVDIMMWSTKTYVICDTTQSPYYNTATDILILAEHRLTRPGFVLLRLLHQTYTPQGLLLSSTFISLNNHAYISSSKYKQLYNQTFGSFVNFNLHGPCTSGYMGGSEMDVAFCFPCLHWPPQAFSWLQRCQRLCWPRPSVLQDITHSGCHFVAIGAKQSIFENVEWRLSFSQAEQKLIYSFNHCQFLVYGLLKLFLKEVLNSGTPENERLLCSYFLKTALFWQVQHDTLTHWSVDNFLLCFWNCFKLLIKWVNCQYCPNFFVPENNMFFPKITGRHQQQLLSQLLGLYKEGVVCLLRSASIRDKIISAIFYPHHTPNPSFELEIKRDSALHGHYYNFMYMDARRHADQIKYIHFYMMKFRSSTTQAQRLFRYRQIIHQFQRFALLQTRTHGRGNIEMYKMKIQSLNLLNQMSGLGNLTDMMYLAMYYYMDGKYTQALCLLQEIKHKLYRPYVLYNILHCGVYIQAMGGKSLSTKLKEAFADDIYIPDFANLSELRLELRVLEQVSRGIKHNSTVSFPLTVSPFVFVHFLTFLCHHQLDSTPHRQQALHELHTLVHSDDDRYTAINTKFTAWQLLGICHRINKNPQQALQCYKKSLTTKDHMITLLNLATKYRIKSIERQLIQQ